MNNKFPNIIDGEECIKNMNQCFDMKDTNYAMVKSGITVRAYEKTIVQTSPDYYETVIT